MAFLKYLGRNKDMFNEFTRELTKEYNVDELFQKYNKNDILFCPNCGKRLTKLMPDGQYLSCNNCNKCYKNVNNSVGEETTLPYNNENVLY